jgi:ferric-dicitrate binding protein FerR (iron transport regulator)
MNDKQHQPPDRLAELLQQSGPRLAPPRDTVERARAAARNAWQAEVFATRRRRMIRTVAYALAAAAVLVMAVARYRSTNVSPAADVMVARVEAGTLRLGDTVLRTGDRVRADALIRTDSAARATLRLGNGAEMRLDVDSAMRIAANGIVALDRGGIFVVTGSSATVRRSVEVRTAAGVVRDIGTSFEVRVIGDSTRVRVRDGLVSLDSRGGSQTAERGIELLADRTGVTRREVGVSGPDWNWLALAAAPFDVDGKTLVAFVDWVSREGGWTVRFADEALRRSASTIILRGSIDGLTPTEALSTILPTCGLTHRIDSDTLIVMRGTR